MPKRSLKETHYPESRFGGFTDIDGTIAFYFRVNALVHPDSVVLDYGCGRGAHAEQQSPQKLELIRFKGRVGRVIGLDVSAAGASNPLLDEFHQLKDDAWPVPDASVDLCYSDHVLEHVEHPEPFFREAARVIKPGGHLCIRTPNAWSYIALAARLVPNRHHASVLEKVVEDSVDEDDVFPTLYRANTRGRLERFLGESGFDGVVYGYEAEPSYLHFSRFAYWLGVLHQRFAPGFMRPSLFAFAQRNG